MTNTTQTNHKQNYTSILIYLGHIEIKGLENVQRMYNLMGFLQQEIQKLEKSEFGVEDDTKTP